MLIGRMVLQSVFVFSSPGKGFEVFMQESHTNVGTCNTSRKDKNSRLIFKKTVGFKNWRD